MRQGADITAVLGPNRQVKAVSALQIGDDFRRQRLLLVERTAGSGMHQEKCGRDNDEQSWYRTCQPLDKIAHVEISLYSRRLTARWTSEAAVLKLPRQMIRVRHGVQLGLGTACSTRAYAHLMFPAIEVSWNPPARSAR